MIEVEKKFVLSPEAETKIAQLATLKSEKVITDAYYDTADAQLGLKDIWLRLRDEQFELKVPLRPDGDKSGVVYYRELLDDVSIREELDLPHTDSLEADLKTAGFVIQAKFTTTRRHYQYEDFTIDLDILDFGYTIGEIELLLEGDEDMAAAEAKIEAFAKEHKLQGLPQTGSKFAEYLRRKNKPYYALLVKGGRIKE